MAYRVLLVDDDPIELQGLQELVPWERFGMVVVDTAPNGIQALSKLRQLQPDLMITDIRMPRLNGLDLAHEAKAVVPQLKIIFASGYDDFQYAKRAIELSADAYVLKPVDDTELFRALERVVEQLEARQRREQEQQNLERSRSYITRQLLFDLLENGMALPDNGLPTGCSWNWDHNVYAAVAELDNVPQILHDHPGEDGSVLLGARRQTMMDFLEQHGDCLYCPTDQHRVAVILPADLGFRTLFSQWMDYVQQTAGDTMTIGVGSAVAGPNTWPGSYRQGRSALNYKMFYGKDRVIYYRERSVDTAAAIQNLKGIRDELLTAVVQGDGDAVERRVQDMSLELREFPEKEAVYNYCLQLLIRLGRQLEDYQIRVADVWEFEGVNMLTLAQFETTVDLQDWLGAKLRVVADEISQRQTQTHHRLLADIQGYAEEHLAGNLRLRDVAEEFGYSPNYLGRVFRDGYGMSFSDYVLQLRMEKAAQLLRESSWKIYRIADEVGYNNLTYFNRQFKDYFHLTPGDYRKTC